MQLGFTRTSFLACDMQFVMQGWPSPLVATQELHPYNQYQQTRCWGPLPPAWEGAESLCHLFCKTRSWSNCMMATCGYCEDKVAGSTVSMVAWSQQRPGRNSKTLYFMPRDPLQPICSTVASLGMAQKAMGTSACWLRRTILWTHVPHATSAS